MSHDNVRSQLHEYDKLQRLIASEVGVGSPTAGPPTSIASGIGRRRDDWGMDHLGNWVNPIGAVPTNPIGRVSTGNLDNAVTPSGLAFAGLHLNASGVGYAPWPAPVASPDATPDTHVAHHAINQQNELQQLHATRDGMSVSTTFAYDAAGNLTDDGVYRYQYDAWGRLLSVHRRAAGGGFGAFVRAYNYDGLGRLTRAQSPYPDPDTFDPEHPGGTNRIERFYYDGVRRIQEVVVDPAASLLAALSSGSSQLLQAAQQSQQQQGTGSLSLEEESTPLAVEAAQQSNAGGGSQQGTTTTRTEREYVWGPGEGWGVAGTDELLAQFDRTGALTFAITDAGGDLVAIVDAGGSGGTARVAGQWTYDAYGNVLSADHIHPHAYTRVGHKGLIFDRLDVGVADRGDDGTFTAGQFVGHPGCDFDTPRIVPFARGFYHNRNRVYMPEFGRFAQADPNASGQTLLDLPVYRGRAFTAGAIGFDVQARYADGGSLFGYMGGNPWQRSDEMGLFAQLFANAVGVGFRALRGGLESMLTQYGTNMEDDLDWAMDWSMSDDGHTRGRNAWVAGSFRAGAVAGFKDGLIEALDPTGGWLWEQLTGDGDTPAIAMASAGRFLPQIARQLNIFRRHGGAIHTFAIQKTLFDKIRHLGGARATDIRVNQAIVDPRNGMQLSTRRPDWQIFDEATNTFHICEVAYSQPVPAAKQKMRVMKRELEALGYTVIDHVFSVDATGNIMPQ